MLVMRDCLIKTGNACNAVLGYEGENKARVLRIKTTDDISDFASVNLLIDTLDCGAMKVETVSNYKVLSIVLTTAMLGETGMKTCQLLMMDAEGTVIKKTNQFYMVVGPSNVIEKAVPDSSAFTIIDEYILNKVTEVLGVDDTLSKKGSPADAKAAGDAIDEIGSRVTELEKGGAIGITVDTEMSDTSENPVQNKVITKHVMDIANLILGSAMDYTKAAVRKIINSDDITVIPTFKGADGSVSMAETTSEYVLVEHDDSDIGSGGSCLYKHYEGYGYISQADLNFGWKRNDGTFVFPVPDQGQLTANDVPLDDIFATMATYIGNTAVQYTSDGQGTLFSETCSGKIDCSSFVCAILQGITYANSRYVRGENIPGSYIGPHYFPTISVQSGRTHSLKVCKLMEWFAAHKQLFSVPSERAVDILRPGDVIFSKVDNMSEKASLALFGVGHAAIVVQTYPRDGFALVAQSGSFSADTSTYPEHNYNIYNMQDIADSGCRLGIIDIQKLVDVGYLKVFARPAYGSGKVHGTNITGNYVSSGLTISQASSTYQEIGWIVPSEALKPNTFYTLEIGGNDIPSWLDNGCYLVARCYYKDGGSNKYDSGKNQMTHVSTHGDSASGGILRFSFVTESDIKGGAVIQLAVLAPGFTGTAKTVGITSAALIEGAPCDTHRMRRLAITAGNNIALTNRSYRMDGKCFLDIVADISNASTGAITIGTLTTGFPGTRGTVQMVGFNGSNVIPVSIDSDGVVTATVTTKSGNIVKILGDFPGRPAS